MGKFPHCLTELSARDKIMAGYYRLTFLLSISFFSSPEHVVLSELFG